MQLAITRNNFKSFFKHQGIFVAFILIFISISFASDAFLTTNNILLVLRQVSIVGIMAIAMTYMLIGGNFDLSVGSILSFSTVLAVDLTNKLGPVSAIIIVLLVAIIIGAVNGVLVGYLKLNSLIVTLGMLPVIQGLTLIYTDGRILNVGDAKDSWFSFIGRGYLLGVPFQVVLMVLLAILLAIGLNKTVYGRKLKAVGGNHTASQFAGIRSSYITFTTFILTSSAAAIGGIVMASRVMGSQNNIGQGYELDVLAAVILGGTSLLGGSGSIFKTLIAVLLLGFINNGLVMLGYPYYTQWIVTWIVIIGAVWLDLASRRGKFFV